MTLAASTGRRVMGTGSQLALGLLLLSLVFEATGIWQLFFLVVAILMLLGARRLWHATGDTIELTRKELRTGSGRVLKTVDNNSSVDRGVFAFKPSNGFLGTLEEPGGKGWVPGLWWQRGWYIGVGGVLRGGQSRAMAEFISGLKDGTLEALLNMK